MTLWRRKQGWGWFLARHQLPEHSKPPRFRRQKIPAPAPHGWSGGCGRASGGAEGVGVTGEMRVTR